jgi:hypothetical protein
MIDVHRVSQRAARWRVKKQLHDTLNILETKCTPFREAPVEASELARAILRMPSWPSLDDLLALDSNVRTLALLDRKKVPEPLWKAFKLVDRRWPGFGLVRRLNALVARARKLLSEAGESDLTMVRREAFGSGERASEAKRFLADVRAIQKHPRTAAKIDWPSYNRFLFAPGPDKRVGLWCGDSPAAPRVTCYARALEMIVGDEYRQRLLDDARDLLVWIACLGNPAYSDGLKPDAFMEWMAQRVTQDAAREHVERKRAQVRRRQERFRDRKISR